MARGHNNISFDQLIQSLQDDAITLQKANKNITSIKVIGVDSRRPKISGHHTIGHWVFLFIAIDSPLHNY